MQVMAAAQTQTAETGIELAALLPAREPISIDPPAPSRTSVPGEDSQPRPSFSDLFDLENAQFGTAAIRSIPRESTTDRIRLKVRDIKSNKIARRTLKAMLAFGTIASLYQLISLFPAFQGAHAATRGLQLQETDSRQNTAYGFLSICANRRTQNLPLGPDCLKYLTMTPKAPPDIDRWMVNSPVVNNSTSALVTRNVEPSLTGRFNETFLNTRLQAQQLSSLRAMYIMLLIYGASIAVVFWFLSRLGSSVFWGPLHRLDRHGIFGRTREIIEDRISAKAISYIDRFVLFSWMLSYYSAWAYVLNYGLKLNSWFATSGFLDICKTKQDLDLPLGEDCLKYMGKELKPAPAFTWVIFISIAGWAISSSVMLLIILYLIGHMLRRFLGLSTPGRQETRLDHEAALRIR